MGTLGMETIFVLCIVSTKYHNKVKKKKKMIEFVEFFFSFLAHLGLES